MGKTVIRTEFFDSITDLNKMILSDEFDLTAENIVNIQWNDHIHMYCVYWRDEIVKKEVESR